MTRLRHSLFALGLAAVLATATLGSSCSKSAPPTAPGAGSAGTPAAGAGGGGVGGNANAGSGGTSGAGGAPGAAGAAAGTSGGQSGADGAAGASGSGDAGPVITDAKRTVVLFLIDGLQPDAAMTAAANGAANLKLVIDGGVTVADAHSTSSAARTTLPSGQLLWGNATSGNIAVHTGTHLYEAGPGGMDDIFVAARAAGIKSVFSGGDDNYSGLTTADFHYASTASTDQVIVQNAIDRIKNDQARVIRIHLQRLRDDWTGPAGKTDPASAYSRHIVADDALLGQLIAVLKDQGLWDSTLLVVTSDHGMGQSTQSTHLPSVRSSWDIFMGFYGPGVKKGATIPYAELPDVAVTAAKFLGLPPLKGHTAASVTIAVKGPTGVALDNIFVGAPDDIAHPRYVDQYLKLGTYPASGDDYQDYRTGMLKLIK